MIGPRFSAPYCVVLWCSMWCTAKLLTSVDCIWCGRCCSSLPLCLPHLHATHYPHYVYLIMIKQVVAALVIGRGSRVGVAVGCCLLTRALHKRWQQLNNFRHSFSPRPLRHAETEAVSTRRPFAQMPIIQPKITKPIVKYKYCMSSTRQSYSMQYIFLLCNCCEMRKMRHSFFFLFLCHLIIALWLLCLAQITYLIWIMHVIFKWRALTVLIMILLSYHTHFTEYVWRSRSF